jgi:hypothetical protein
VRSSALAVEKPTPSKIKTATRRKKAFTGKLLHVCAAESILEFPPARNCLRFFSVGVFPEAFRPMIDELKKL